MCDIGRRTVAGGERPVSPHVVLGVAFAQSSKTSQWPETQRRWEFVQELWRQ